MRIRWNGREAEFDTVVFDLFHTLVDPQDHAPPGFRRLSAIAAILDLPLLDIELWWQQAVGELVAAPLSPVDALVEFAQSRRIVLSPTAIAELDRAMGAHADAALANPIAGTEQALTELGARGVSRVVLSNAVVRDVRVFADSPLAPLVDAARISCFTGLVKPDQEAYLDALTQVEARAERSLFVGDGGSDELAGARATGFAAVVAVTGAIERGGWRPIEEQERVLGDADLGVEDLTRLMSLMGD